MLRRHQSDASSSNPASESLSGLSNSDDAEDTFERRMASALRDQQRMRHATVGPAQVFANRRRDVSLRTAMEEAGNAATGAPTPITALGDVTNDKRLVHDASPSRRLPREWGTKGRRDLEYLRRLRDPESPEQKDSSRKDGTGAAAAPSTEAEKQAPIRPHDSHRSRIPQKTTRIDDILQVQRDEEEPDHPLPSSFRPARRRTYDSRQRRRDLQEPGSRRSTSVADAPKTTDMAPQPSVSEPEVVEESVARPAKRDSRQLLKQLARAASATPSPPPKNFTMRRAAALADAAVAPKRGPEPKDSLKRESRRTHLDSGATLGGSRPSQVPRMRSPEEVAQGGKNGPSISSIPETAKFATTTELAPLESTEPPSQTPKVTGSWIETPVAPRLSFGSRASAEAGVHKPKQAEDADQAPAQSVEDKQTEPIHQTTEKIGEHATRSSRTGKESAPRSISGQDKAGDASLDRQAAPVLRDVTDQDVDISSLMNVGDDTLEMVSKESGATSRAESDRLKELVALKEMAQRLHAARSGLRGVKKDMKRVEAKIGSQEAAQDAVKDEVEAASTNAKLTSPTPPPAMAQQELRVSTLLRNEFNAFKATLYQRRSSGRIRLTWFGIAFLILVVWCLSEVTLCEYYCHPLYARYMVGYGVNIYAPRMPFVTTTLLFRAMKWFWEPPLRFLVWSLAILLKPVEQFLVSVLRDDQLQAGATKRRAVPASSPVMQAYGDYSGSAAYGAH